MNHENNLLLHLSTTMECCLLFVLIRPVTYVQEALREGAGREHKLATWNIKVYSTCIQHLRKLEVKV